MIERLPDQHEPVHELGALERDVDRHRGAVAEADEVRARDAESVHERDRVLRHVHVGDRPLDVGGPAMAAPLRHVDAEALRERRRQTVERLDGAQPAVQQDEGIADALHLVVGVHLACLNVVAAEPF